MTRGSALFEGKVRHTRLRPVSHDFEYGVFYLMFDLDELDELDRSLRLLSVGRSNLFRFEPADHGPLDGSDLRTWADATFVRAGIHLDGGRVKLLAFPRMLGYAFNPLSIWYGYDAEGVLRGVIHEVRNTFGDRHIYVAGVDPDDLGHSFDKKMHVSPFNDLDQTYDFTINDPGNRLLLSINQSDREGAFLRAGMRLSRRDLSDGELLRQFFGHPLLTAKVIFGIHYQALKLWLKGAVFHRRPEPPADTITIMGTATANS